jgi:hypothetical protein
MELLEISSNLVLTNIQQFKTSKHKVNGDKEEEEEEDEDDDEEDNKDDY